MKALVTGATGFVGNHVARAVARRGIAVKVLARSNSRYLNMLDPGWETVNGDLRDAASLQNAARGCQVVFHVAALYQFWPLDERPYYETNVLGTRNVLQAALSEGVRRVVYTSSWVTVGLPRQGKDFADEEDQPRQSELTGAYRRTKYLAEREALGFASRGLDVVVVNPTVPVGPGDARPTPTGRLVLDFLRRRTPAYVQAQLNLAPVEDVAEGHVLALDKGRKGERYILGGDDMTLQEVLRMLAELTGFRAPSLVVPYGMALVAASLDQVVEGTLLKKQPRIPWEGVLHARRRVKVDSAKAVRELGYRSTSVRQALERAVAWYREREYVRPSAASTSKGRGTEGHDG
ncbi:MAG: NAD-dependent epimerase/dehydratase family protein [SAR202 cluster bacterium]|nr:NAD-dependent epimerase/dehydratase family protein [SAR202 cluster bacterium]